MECKSRPGSGFEGTWSEFSLESQAKSSKLYHSRIRSDLRLLSSTGSEPSDTDRGGVVEKSHGEVLGAEPETMNQRQGIKERSWGSGT